MGPWWGAMCSLMTFPVWAAATLARQLEFQAEQAAAWGQLWRAVSPQTPDTPPGRPEDLYVGKTVSKTKTVSDVHTAWFGLLSLDFNPLHFNEALARHSRFHGRIAHGLHTASLFTGVLAELTPWCAYLRQDIDFTAPVRPGDVLTATGMIEEIDAKGNVQVALAVRNQNGDVVVRGRAIVKQLREMFQAPAAA